MIKADKDLWFLFNPNAPRELRVSQVIADYFASWFNISYFWTFILNAELKQIKPADRNSEP